MATLRVPVTKGKGYLEIDTEKLPQHVYEAMLAEGAKHYLNAGMTKITVAKLEGEELEKAKAAAMAKAESNLENIYAGKIRIVGQKAAGKVAGAVMTEARRIARNIIKEQMKAAGLKVSHYPAAEITKAANALIASTPDIVKEAEESLAKRSAVKTGEIDLKALLVADPKLVAAAEAKKKKPVEGAVLSAAKAGQTAKRQKPGKGQPQANA